MINIELLKAFNESICCYTQKQIREVLAGSGICGQCKRLQVARYIGSVMLTASEYYQITCKCEEPVYWAVLDEEEED